MGSTVFSRKLSRAVLAREIAYDGMRLPQDESIVVDRRHQTVRIQRSILGRVIDAELHSGVDTLVADVELSAAPEHFLNIDGIRPTPVFSMPFSPDVKL